MHKVFSLILQSVAAAFSFFTQIYESTGMLSTYLGVMIISMFLGKIISPMLRNAGSDRARTIRSNRARSKRDDFGDLGSLGGYVEDG